MQPASPLGSRVTCARKTRRGAQPAKSYIMRFITFITRCTGPYSQLYLTTTATTSALRREKDPAIEALPVGAVDESAHQPSNRV
jgi:hypothetical protein